MSAPSGIKVPDDLTAAFTAALTSPHDTRALVFIIDGESFKHHATIQPKASYKDDIALIPQVLPSPKTPASFAYRLDSRDNGKWDWMMVTFVPDNAGVRAKMLQASSRSGLMKALGANNFKHDWFATSISDLTPAALTAHLNHLSSPPPLSASEAALAEVREAEAAEAERAALDPEGQARRHKAVVGLGGKMIWGDGVAEALQKAAQRSDVGWVVVLEISSSNPGSIALLKSEACTPSQLTSKIPEKSPCYVFYSHPTPPSTRNAPKPSSTPIGAPRNKFQGSQGGVRVVNAQFGSPALEAGEKTVSEEPEDDASSVSPAQKETVEDVGKGRVIFVYCCPPNSPVKYRMIYSTTVRGVQQDASDKAGVEIAAKLETSDPSELTESHLKSSLPSYKPTHSSSLPIPASSTLGGRSFGTPAMFGQPRPPMPVRSASQVPLPPSGASTPAAEGGNEGEEDGKENIRRAFEAFGPRVNNGGGGGFARPRPAGRR
ncbi:Protein tyrosine kinase, putative [Cryptococcus gattii WM276]|uniref:Protein tyrosine kinase, putative n=1 Tax=Cryptococcus gattii serotype B (strain WM276 / ATCC MYA-4071) TaxID=367775 RepID=E6QZH2_CRYGW|nr:Protein tyrosine kinase, putative [Cryptococcus gattii WM276]ADV19486.1 Protein tyrosine kinase, putative [Cryptococcus gattii WM276]